ncbi:MAG: DUF433 domain-containing protein [Leptolyngbyaceae cyanobacterium MAG.088]|nr:DUF433 domain-containing protein [Leptolyngbyaceae cyanobacterium MAG.088]
MYIQSAVISGDACIANIQILVWRLVSYRQQAMSNGQILEGYPDHTAADLVTVWAYALDFGE